MVYRGLLFTCFLFFVREKEPIQCTSGHQLSSLVASCKMEKTSIILITSEELAKGLFRLTSPPKGHETLGLETRPLQKGPFSYFHLTRIILELSLKYFTRNLPPTLCSFTRGKSSSCSWKKQPKTNIQTHTIKQPNHDQFMHLSFYREKNHDLTWFLQSL